MLDTTEFVGTCGTTELPNMPRNTKADVLRITKQLKTECDNYGVVITTVKNPTKQQQEWMRAAGWKRTLQYRGQYDENGWGYEKPKYYPMQHWCLVIKPWSTPRKKVTK